MAELSVGATLSLAELVLRLGDNFNSRKHVQTEIGNMKRWLRSIKAFIEDNDGREGSSRLLEVKLENVRDTANDIEDVLDEILLHTSLYVFHDYKITRKVHNIAHHIYHGFPFHEISDKIANIKRSIDVIEKQRAALSDSYSNPRPSSSSQTRVASPLLLDEEMVGYENPKRKFISQLMDADQSLVRLVVEGPCGSGKTTFVENVYQKEGICGQFDCHAWVHVSSHFDVEELSINMLKQLCVSMKEPYPSDESLATLLKLKNYLTGKRYIVVLDDIWRKEQWDEIKKAFPDLSCLGSRIIFTTSFSGVAAICASSHDHICSLKNGLESLDAWILFCRKAFPDSNRECPMELKDISQQIVQRCEGLPLAIVAVCGVLAQTTRRPNEWKSFYDSLGRQLGSNSILTVISNSLLPFYMDLSTDLKSCFMYLSLFPEDYSVERGRLIRLWVAEGFVQEKDCRTAEEVAKEYLNELIGRNLVDVSYRDFDGRPRSCRVRHLVLQFIIQKCKHENFASIFPRENTSQSQRIRRLSLHNDFTSLPQNSNVCGVRSLFLLRSPNISPSDFKNYLSEFKLLRVLDLQGARLKIFFKAITLLTLLRYLSLRATTINMIPNSIKKLSYLETLDLKQTDVTELPNEISYLRNLRHLFAYKYDEKTVIVFDSIHGVKISEGISNLSNLQDLSLVKVDQKGRILKELQELSQLRKLGLMGIKEEHGKDLCASIQKMQKLTTLDLSSITKEEYLEVGEMEDPPPTLERLYLKGRLKEFPRWIFKLDSLLRIGLKWSKMEQSPLRALKCLPNLMELQLVESYIGEELIFEASGFKELKILQIHNFSELNMVVIQKGAMPNLEKILLHRCPQLELLPLGIENLTNIGEMILLDMSEEFIAQLRDNGEYRKLVEHIPVVHF